jgi:SAM-dependent methyltransferase
MYLAERTLTLMRSFLKTYGPSKIKRILWDEEFAGNKWNFIDHTVEDCVYPYLEKYVQKGSILDLGCGPGNTASELAANAYRTYLGVDISEAALGKAARRTKEAGRTAQNHFVCADFLNYDPDQQFDVILFRESMYHVPLGSVKKVLDRYSDYLKSGGVFIVRMFISSGDDPRAKRRPKAMLRVIEAEFDVIEKCQYGASGPTVIVFRPPAMAAQRVPA